MPVLDRRRSVLCLIDFQERLMKAIDGAEEVVANAGRLLAAGNGGSAAQAHHLTAELVGRYRADRPPFCQVRRPPSGMWIRA